MRRPADCGASAVFGDKDLLQLGGRDAGERRSCLADREQELRDIAGFVQSMLGEVVPPAERDCPALADVALELEFAKRQLLDVGAQLPFHVGRDDVVA